MSDIQPPPGYKEVDLFGAKVVVRDEPQGPILVHRDGIFEIGSEGFENLTAEPLSTTKPGEDSP